MSSAQRRLFVSATILLLPVVILCGAWRLGGVSALEDDLIYYLPTRQYIAERIRAGEFPVWNPLVAMGSPLAADPQSGLWYPPTYLFLLLPPLVAYPVSLVLHFALAGGGMYRFLRASRRDWRAALLGAVAFEFCGYLVAHRAHLTIHHAVAWVPWILYGWRRFADTGRGKYAVLASAAFGMQLLVQHVQVSIITAVLVTGYVAVVLVGWRAGGKDAHPREGGQDAHRPGYGCGGGLRRWWVFPVGMLAGVLMAGVQLAPTWLYYAGSVRGAPNYYLFSENSWLPASAPLLLFPMLLGARTPNLWTERWWGPSHFCEQSAYASILVLVLAAASIRLVRWPWLVGGDGATGEDLAPAWRYLRGVAPRVWRSWSSGPIFEALPEGVLWRRVELRRRLWNGIWQDARAAWERLPYGWNREAAFWWGACLVALLIALGDLTPLGKLLFHVPLYRSLRVPARWMLVWSVAMPVLAAMVVSTLLRGDQEARRVAGAVRFTAMRALPVAAALCLLLLAVAAHRAEGIAARFPVPAAAPKIAGLLLASRLDNAAIWWPLLVMGATAWSLLRWIRTRGRGAFALMFGIFLTDVAAVAGFVDVDVRTYSRQDLTTPPPLARAIRELGMRPGDRLLVPRTQASYERPIEVLWPQSNLRYGIATLNGYGPLGTVGSRMLFRFMPWGSSEEMLAVLRNKSLLRAMGVRFIAVRSSEERELLRLAELPSCTTASQHRGEKGRHRGRPLQATEDSPSGPGSNAGVGRGAESAELVPGTEQIKPVRYGQDLLWGPVAIESPGLYELSCEVVPVKGTSSRWFVRLEKPDKCEINRTRTVEPADMAAGPRRMRFLYCFDRPVPEMVVRVKSEIGEALSAGRATMRQVAVEPPASQANQAENARAFIHRADLPGHVSLYEVPQTRPLAYWAGQVECVPDLVTAIDRLEAGVANGPAGEDQTLLEQGARSRPVAAVQDGEVGFSRPMGNELRVKASSSTGGLLVFNESGDCGWHATVDGRQTPIFRVNVVCQGVMLSAGEHEVRFSYWPAGLEAGAIASATGLLLLGTMALAGSRGQSRLIS